MLRVRNHVRIAEKHSKGQLQTRDEKHPLEGLQEHVGHGVKQLECRFILIDQVFVFHPASQEPINDDTQQLHVYGQQQKVVYYIVKFVEKIGRNTTNLNNAVKVLAHDREILHVQLKRSRLH